MQAQTLFYILIGIIVELATNWTLVNMTSNIQTTGGVTRGRL